MDGLYDVIVIGGGPAGLTAALYLARARFRVLVLEKEQFGGQIAITQEVVNYPGIAKTSGKALTDTMRSQAETFGAEFLLAQATHLDCAGDVKTVSTNHGDFQCLAVLLATGAHPRAVGFQGEAAYRGRGVAYCATCDGEFFTDKEVFVIGGGYAAAEESIFLTKFARHVTILIRKDDFSCAASVAEKARSHEKITVLTNTVVQEVSGAQGLNYIRYRNTLTGEVTQYRAKEHDYFGVFVLAGYEPNTALVRDLAQLDEHGYIITDSARKTSVDGLYAAGDVCIKPLRQVVTATADGALAATEVEKYVVRVKKDTGLYTAAPQPKRIPKPVAVEEEAASESLFTPEMRHQLDTVFSKMETPLVLRLYLDERPVSAELESFIRALAALSPKLSVVVASQDALDTPCVKLYRPDGSDTGLAFHGVPGGHEFTSFVLALYNAAGPGQTLDAQTMQKIAAIRTPSDLKILVSLSCTMCPDLVTAAQRIAAANPLVTAHVYDLQHFEHLRQRYQVMSVPCLVINNTTVSFGRKNMEQLLQLLLHDRS